MFTYEAILVSQPIFKNVSPKIATMLSEIEKFKRGIGI